jgi:2-iminobutanoate/2-iminopropanoate deaminase
MSLKPISSPNAPNAVGPYSQGMVVENRIYTSGQIGIDPATGTMVPGDIEAQTRRVLANLKAVLEAGGSSYDRVIKTTVFLTNLADFARMNVLYAEAFGDHRPARSTIQVAALPLGAIVEIEAIAVVG